MSTPLISPVHLGSIAANTTADQQILLLRVRDVMAILNMSRTVIFDQIRTGRLRSVKQGRIRLIPVSAVTEYVALLEQEAA